DDIIVFITQDSGNHYLAMKFKRRTNAAALGLQYLPEVTADKLTWYSDSANVLNLSVEPSDALFDWVTVRDMTPLTPEVARFSGLHIISGTNESASPLWIGPDNLVRANDLTLFSQRMVRPILSAGMVAAVNYAALTDTNAAFASNQFGTNGTLAYVEFNNGDMVDIANTTTVTNNLVLAGSVAGMASVGDAYRIRAHFTIASLFGTNNEAGLTPGPNPAVADTILVQIPDTQALLTIFWFSNYTTTFQGWVRADGFKPAANQVIYPEQ